MFGANTLLTVYLAPKDAYTFENFREWHSRTKRRWRGADLFGADEIKVMENNRRHDNKYKSKLKIFGWKSDTKVYADGRTYDKGERIYQDYIGDPYYDYFKRFYSYMLGWWGVSKTFKKGQSKKDRNTKSVPNSPMLDVSIHYDKNSFMEKIYLQGMGYDEAIGTTFKGKATSAELISSLSEYYKNEEGMEEKAAFNEAMRMVDIVHRNIALDKNSPTNNDYNFMINYYNKFIDKKLREMMKIQINFWFLKEAMSYNPNLSFYVLGPYNQLSRIQGIVGKRGQNVVVKMKTKVNTTKYEFDYVYSLDKDTLINDADKGYIKAKDLTRSKSKILNAMNGRQSLDVEHRYRTEMFYDLILEAGKDKEIYPWFDANHNCWVSPNYTIPKNLFGKDILT